MEDEDLFEGGDLTEAENRAIRQEISWLRKNRPHLEWLVQVKKMWWLFVAGAGAAATGLVTEALSYLTGGRP